MLDLRRREFIALIGGAVAARPLTAYAQQARKVWRIGVLETTTPALNAANLDALRSGLRDLGYVEGQNLAFEYRSAEGRSERFAALAAELVGIKVDLIVTRGTTAALAAKNATTTIPIVMAAVGEPLGTGIVAELARPGGNVTGLSAFVSELVAKRIELLQEAIVGIKRLGFLSNLGNLVVPPQWEEMKRAARLLNIEVQMLDIRKPEDLGGAFDAAAAQRITALYVGNDTVTLTKRRQVTELALKHRLPTVHATREFVDSGGLLSYAVSYPELYRRAASYIDKIFKGAKAADLPIEQPTRFELVINLKTAKALGLDVPPSLLARADEVIE